MVGLGHHEVGHSKSGKGCGSPQCDSTPFDLRSELKLVNRKFGLRMVIRHFAPQGQIPSCLTKGVVTRCFDN